MAVTVSGSDLSDKNFTGTFLDYFPISDGAYWIYDYTLKEGFSEQTGTRTVTISGTEEINGKEYWVTMEDDELSGIHTRIENNIVYSHILVHETVELFGTDIPLDSDLLSFDLNLEPGATWKILEFEDSKTGNGFIITGEYIGKEDVTVPAGIFEGCKKFEITTVLKIGAGTTKINVNYNWLAPDVGVVKNTQRITLGLEVTDREEVLKEYDIP
ncbi:hypothetical protein ES703_114107 [subsurface metagenome]